MLWLALGCLLLGLSPVFVVLQIDNVALSLIGHDLGSTAARTGWLWLTPVAAERASYSPLILFVIIVAGCYATYLVVRKFYHGSVRRSPAWDCGYPAQTARMQDTAEGFGQPIRQIFDFFFGVTREVPSPFDSHPHYHGETHDRLWNLLYLPIARMIEKFSIADRQAATWPHPAVPAVQLRHPDRPAGVCPMTTTTLLFQLFQNVLVLLAAPLLLGWVNQCRAWMQNRSGAGILQPYRTPDQAVPQGCGAGQ